MVNIDDMGPSDLHRVNRLVKDVFDRFVLPDYTKEGVRAFYNFTDENSLYTRLMRGNLFFVARVRGDDAGVIEIRDLNHVALFFVREKFQKQGIGRALFSHALERINALSPKTKEITVNSSPYAVPVYEALGFTGSGRVTVKDGMTFYPMLYITGN